nr:MAG TPA: hypothetical protein [Caudoviricetes sp.]
MFPCDLICLLSVRANSGEQGLTKSKQYVGASGAGPLTLLMSSSARRRTDQSRTIDRYLGGHPTTVVRLW